MRDKTVIGNIGFRLSGDWLYPYASGVQTRGTPQYTNSGNWMNITGFNYPGFYMDNDTYYEDLSMYFVETALLSQDMLFISKSSPQAVFLSLEMHMSL